MLTKTRTALISLLLTAAATTPVLADAADDFNWAVIDFKNNLTELKDHWSVGLSEERPEGSCHALLAKAKADGLEVTEKQTQLCDEFKKYHQLAEAQKALLDARYWMQIVDNVELAASREEGGPKMIKSAAECTATIDRLAAAGMAMDIKVRVSAGGDGLEITMSEAKAKICDPLAKIAATYAKDVGAARAKAAEAAAAPFKKIGVTGERLRLLATHFDYYAMYGVGGTQLRSPQQLKTAKVIFELLGPNTATGRYTLRRYQFAGDKIVSTTERDFLVRPGAKHFK